MECDHSRPPPEFEQFRAIRGFVQPHTLSCVLVLAIIVSLSV